MSLLLRLICLDPADYSLNVPKYLMRMRHCYRHTPPHTHTPTHTPTHTHTHTHTPRPQPTPPHNTTHTHTTPTPTHPHTHTHTHTHPHTHTHQRESQCPVLCSVHTGQYARPTHSKTRRQARTPRQHHN